MIDKYLRDLLTIRNGRDHKALKDGAIPVLGSGGLMRHVNKSLYDKPSILLPRKGSLINIQYTDKPFWTVDTLYYTEINEKKAVPYFLYYYLKQLDISQLWTGTGVPSMTNEAYYSIPVSLPDLPTQLRIAGILGSLDEKIEINRRKIAKLEALAKLIYDHWFVQFEFPDANGKPYKSSGGKMVWNETLKKTIPHGWTCKKIENLISVSKETLNPQDNPQNIYLHFSLPSFDKTGSYMQELGKTIQSNKFIVCEKDVIVSKLNPWFSRVLSVGKLKNAICSTEFVVWRTNNDAIKNCLFLIARSTPFIDFCTRSATGTSNSHKRVNPEIMVSYSIPFDDGVYGAFGRAIAPFLQSINAAKSANIQLTETRDFLLPLLMNGQVEITG